MTTAQKTAYSLGLVVIAVVAFMALGIAKVEATTVVQAPTCTMSISPSSVYSGDSSILSWSSTNANLAVIDQGVGSVSSSGSQTISNLTSSKTYTMTVSGPGGSASCVAMVGVLPRENQLPSCTITANPSHLTQGNATTLTWSSTNAQNASISNGVGIVSTSGTYTVTPQSGVTMYTLTVNGTGGSNTCSTSVTTDYNYNNYQYQQPYCTISVSPTYTQYGQYATLSWNAYGTNVYGPYIDNGVGSVALSGTRSVHPYQTTTYRMVVNDQQGRSNSCQTTLSVGGSNYNPNYYNQPAYYNYVPLRHIPYTGTEDTLFMVFVVLLTLGSWSTAGYMLYSRRDQLAALLK